MAAGIKQLSKTFVWILMGMLIVGLAGFGAVNFSGSMNAVAVVGDRDVSVEDYIRDLQTEQRSIQAQSGQYITLSQMRDMGLDQQVLARLIALASIDNEVDKLGVSIGDENLLDELTNIPAFQGTDGTFDRDSYRFALENVNLTEAEFEEDLRRETARTIVQGAILSGVEMSPVVTDTITEFVRARRSFSYVLLDGSQVGLTQVEPTEGELKAFYEENAGQFTLPETKVLTYVLLTPDMMLDDVEVDETALQQLYEDRADVYQVPERRLVERLVFSDQEAAASAMAQLELNGTTFENLVIDRQLALSDVDLGDLTREELGEAGDAIFDAKVGQVVGPLPTSLGPALFRVNGQLAERITTFEEARDELRAELAADRARRVIEQQSEGIDDLLAGGATLEELPAETAVQLGSLNWTPLTDEGVAAYAGFRAAAEAVSAEDFPQVDFLEDGSLFALRLDEILPERPEPFAEARDEVYSAYKANRLTQALIAQGEALKTGVETNGTFPEGHEVKVETGLTRTAYIDETPADMMNQVFEMELGEARVLSEGETVVVVKLDAQLAPEETEDTQLLREALSAQLDQALSQALFEAFVRDAQLRAAPRVDQQALNAVQANFQ